MCSFIRPLLARLCHTYRGMRATAGFPCLRDRRFSREKTATAVNSRGFRRLGARTLALGEQIFPCQRMGDDSIEVVVLRAPSESRADARDIGNQRGGIAGAARSETDREVVSAHALDR